MYDYYEELGVDADASQEEIDIAFKSILYPSWRQEKVYQTLSNIELRKKYDAVRLFERSREKQTKVTEADFTADGAYEILLDMGLSVTLLVIIINSYYIIRFPFYIVIILGLIAIPLSFIFSRVVIKKIAHKQIAKIEAENARIYARNKIRYEQIVGEPYETVAKQYELKVYE